jgi:hypothetical protein
VSDEDQPFEDICRVEEIHCSVPKIMEPNAAIFADQLALDFRPPGKPAHRISPPNR